MTSEAKIGLLLGLVFIFIIAFIINGLPSFWHKTDGNELTVAAENAQDNAAGIGVNERKAGEAIERIEPATAANTSPVVVETQGNTNVRFATELPKDGTNTAAKCGTAAGYGRTGTTSGPKVNKHPMFNRPQCSPSSRLMLFARVTVCTLSPRNSTELPRQAKSQQPT